MHSAEAPKPDRAETPAATPRLSSEDLLQGLRRVVIDHEHARCEPGIVCRRIRLAG